MEKLNSIEEVLQLISQGEIVFFLTQNNPTFFARRKERILVKNAGSTYRIDEEELRLLFKKEEFYLYEPAVQMTVDMGRDEEYYSWKHK